MNLELAACGATSLQAHVRILFRLASLPSVLASLINAAQHPKNMHLYIIACLNLTWMSFWRQWHSSVYRCETTQHFRTFPEFQEAFEKSCNFSVPTCCCWELQSPFENQMSPPPLQMPCTMKLNERQSFEC